MPKPENQAANPNTSGDACYAPTMQQMLDAGLNGFAVQLLSESIAQCKAPLPLKFRYGSVMITIEPAPDN